MWFALQTTPQAEFKAVKAIERMAVNAQCPAAAVCPLVVERRVRNRKSATIEQEVKKPLFQGYAFIEAAFIPDWIFREKFVVRVLTSPIPDHLMVSALARSGTITVDEWNRIKRHAVGASIRRKGISSGFPMNVLSADDENLVAMWKALGKTHTQTFRHDQVEAAE
jgi:transcription antitermination factor NusG